jgi:hypothetical protein
MTLTAALLALAVAHPYGPRPPPPPYAPPYGAPQQQQQYRGAVGIVFLPLGTGRLHAGQDAITYEPGPQGALALEVRSPYVGPLSGGRLRLSAEFSEHDRIADASLKFNFLDPLPLQPFLTLGVGAGRLGPETDWRGALVASAGVDFFFTPNLFLSAELKGRAFADLPASSLSNVYGNDVTETVALFGLGAYF